MQITATAFKAYDIRGVVPDALDPGFAHALGLAFGDKAWALGERQVVVGRDGRLSSPRLAEALIQGLVDAGLAVTDIGLATTPMTYYAAHVWCQSGIQVTGSHNPKHHNGFKMVLAGRAIYGEDIQDLRRAIEADALPRRPGGSVRCQSVQSEYVQRIVADVHLARPLKLVIDSGNGVAGASAPGLFRALGCDVIELFSEVDGEFPNHHPDPSKPENLRDLVATLASSGADLGLAFDGDGDRLGIVTPSGQNIYPDRQMMLFAQDVLSRVPGGAVVYDVKCSQRLAPAIQAAGGVPVMYKTGHSLVKAKMRELDAPLGGEMSGHIFFKERWYGFDDGSYAGARLLEILSRVADPGALLDALPSSHSTPELNVACADGEQHALVSQLQQRARFPAPAVVNLIDGVRVDWPDGFGLVRASNTTPVLVLRFEGQTPEALGRIQNTLWDWLLQTKPDAVIVQGGH